MTAVLPVSAPHSNSARRPVLIDVSQSDLVGLLLDLQTLASEAIDANGYALQTVLGLLSSAIRSEAQRGCIDTHERLVRLLNTARVAAGTYDTTRPRA
jgi:hypothetical protein